MGNLPFERNRYNPVQDVTPEEAERNKRQQSQQEAAIRDPKTDEEKVPGANSEKASG